MNPPAPNSAFLRLHHFLPGSRANGPGTRAVIWTQGCSLACPGCFNPDTHAFDRGEWVSVDTLFAKVCALGDSVEGLTVSGGEPLQQLRALSALLRRIRRESNLSVIVFTGFTWDEISRMAAPSLPPEARVPGTEWPTKQSEFLDCVDVLIAGRYDSRQRLARGLRGSANKTVHFLTDRYSLKDLDAVPEAEVMIGAEGDLILSGIEPVLALSGHMELAKQQILSQFDIELGEFTKGR